MKKLLLIIMLLFYIVSLNAQSINNEIELFFDEQFTEQINNTIKITEYEYSINSINLQLLILNNEIELFFDEQFTEQVDDNIKITESEYSTHKLLATI